MLVDTNVVSEFARLRPDPHVVRWSGTEERMQLSAVSIEELRYGIRLRGSARLDRWLDVVIAASDILPVTTEIAERSASLRALRERAGRHVAQADMLIAATAAEHRLVLATRNVRDFTGCGIQLVNPFAARRD